MSETLQPHGPEVAEILGMVATMGRALPDHYAPQRLTYLSPRPPANPARRPCCDLELGVPDPRLTVEEQLGAEEAVLAGLQRYARANNIPSQPVRNHLQVTPPGLAGFELFSSVHTTNAVPPAGARRLKAQALVDATLCDVVKVIGAPLDCVTIMPADNKTAISVGHAGADTVKALHDQFGERITATGAHPSRATLDGNTCITVHSQWTTAADTFHLRFLTHEATVARAWMASLPTAQVTDRLPKPRRWRKLLPFR